MKPSEFQGQDAFIDRQLSFTLFETIVAVGLLATVIVNVSLVQGNSIVFSEYTRNLTHAIWLSKRIMSQVEYQKTISDFKDLESDLKEQKFKEATEDDEAAFLYDLEIVPFNFPITKMITKHFSGSLGGGEGDDQAANPIAQIAPLIEQQMQQYLGDDFFKLVKLEVKWSDGAKEDSLTTQMLIADQKKLSEVYTQLKAIAAGGGIPGVPPGVLPGTSPASGQGAGAP